MSALMEGTTEAAGHRRPGGRTPTGCYWDPRPGHASGTWRRNGTGELRPVRGGAMAPANSTTRRRQNVRAVPRIEKRRQRESNAVHIWIGLSTKPCSSCICKRQAMMMIRTATTAQGPTTRTTATTSATARWPCDGSSTRAGSFGAGSSAGMRATQCGRTLTRPADRGSVLRRHVATVAAAGAETITR